MADELWLQCPQLSSRQLEINDRRFDEIKIIAFAKTLCYEGDQIDWKFSIRLTDTWSMENG